jgi:putative nucleotidyltransferase with HDIG domain
VAAIILSEAKPARPSGVENAPIRVVEVISALSYALDLTEGQPMGHSVRNCVIGMRIAEELGLSIEDRSDLYYSLLMKDAGCSTNASRMFQILGTDEIKAKRDVKTTDWTRVGWETLQYALSHVHTGAPFMTRMRALFEMARNQKTNAKELVQIRCERGADIAARVGLSAQAANAIYSLDEHWSGAGQPLGLRGTEIPMLSRIMNLSQTVDVFYTTYGAAGAIEVAKKRSGRWFDPAVVRAFCSIAKRESLWADVDNASSLVVRLEPRPETFPSNELTIDNICMAFADVIDAKSPFTYRHSTGVAGAAVAIGRTLSMTESEITLLRRAALLHDVGKLSVPNSILDKPAKLSDQEWECVRQHPSYSFEILKRIPGFKDLSEIAASHHEKLDGSGYFRGISSDRLSLPARILVVSDIYDALAAKRPYRDALPIETVFGIMQKDAPRALDANCFEALKCSVDSAQSVTDDLIRMSRSVRNESAHVAPEAATLETETHKLVS